MKLYIYVEGCWHRWTGATSFGELQRDRRMFRNAGYCTALVIGKIVSAL